MLPKFWDNVKKEDTKGFRLTVGIEGPAPGPEMAAVEESTQLSESQPQDTLNFKSIVNSVAKPELEEQKSLPEPK